MQRFRLRVLKLVLTCLKGEDLRGRQLGLMVELPLDVELDLLTGGQALHLDQDLVEVIRIELESHRRHHLDVQVLVLDPAEDVVDQLVEDGLWIMETKENNRGS